MDFVAEESSEYHPSVTHCFTESIFEITLFFSSFNHSFIAEVSNR